VQATCKALPVERHSGELEGVAVNRDTPPALSAHSFPRRVLPFYVPGLRTTTRRECRAKQVFGPTRRRNVAIQGELRRPRRQAQPPDSPLPMAAAWHLSRHHHLVFDGIHARRLIVVKTAGTPHMAGSSTQTP
jgi:hypothetical protein